MRDENIWTRLPEVTAKVSGGGAVVSAVDGGGKEICVMGFECSDGRRSWLEKECQYLCSGVRVAGPAGSFTG